MNRIYALCILIMGFSLSHTAYSETMLAEVTATEYKNDHSSKIKFLEEDSADCAIAEGKLILIQNTDATQAMQVWVDRWFMNVQTADHTKHILLPQATPTPLGCSEVKGGGKQHWTLYSATAI